MKPLAIILATAASLALGAAAKADNPPMQAHVTWTHAGDSCYYVTFDGGLPGYYGVFTGQAKANKPGAPVSAAAKAADLGAARDSGKLVTFHTTGSAVDCAVPVQEISGIELFGQ